MSYPGLQTTATERQPAQQRLTALLVRTGIINSALLAAAVVAFLVLELVDPEVGVWLVVAAAAVGAVHLFAVLTAHMRRNRSELAASTPGVDPPVGTGFEGLPHGAFPHPGGGVAGPGPGGFVMAVQDVFTVTGRGTVVTGSVQQGFVDVGTTVTLVRGGSPVQQAEVTGVEMFRALVTRAVAGDHVGLLLRGVGRADVERGDLLTA